MNTVPRPTGLMATIARLIADARRAFCTLQHIQFDAPWQPRTPRC